MKTNCKHNIYDKRPFIAFCVFVALITASSISLATESEIYKQYTLDIDLFSVDPNRPLDSYKWYGSGYASEAGKVGLSCADKQRSFSIEVSPSLSNGRFIVNVAVVPGKHDSNTKADSFDVDFTDLRPRNFELARNEDGYLYMLNLTPGIKIVDNRPQKADATSFKFSRWAFDKSMVIFNDSVYIGKMGCSGGSLAYVSYPGLAKVEFALKPFRDAKVLGTLKDGRIQIHSEDGQSLDIYGVKNGVHKIQLPGGPYEVWVRWQNLPGEAKFEIPAKEEWIRMVRTRFAETGNTAPSDEELNKGYERIKHEKHLPLTSGVGPIKPFDRMVE